MGYICDTQSPVEGLSPTTMIGLISGGSVLACCFLCCCCAKRKWLMKTLNFYPASNNQA